MTVEIRKDGREQVFKKRRSNFPRNPLMEDEAVRPKVIVDQSRLLMISEYYPLYLES